MRPDFSCGDSMPTSPAHVACQWCRHASLAEAARLKRGPKGWLARDAALAAKQAMSSPWVASSDALDVCDVVSDGSSFSSFSTSTVATASEVPPSQCLCRAHAAADGSAAATAKERRRKPVGCLAFFAWCAGDGGSSTAIGQQ